MLGLEKVAHGFGRMLGDVELYGHEPTSTLAERKERLDKEKLDIENLDTSLSHAEFLDYDQISDLSEENSNALVIKAVKLIKTLSFRIRDLRLEECKKNMLLDKLMKEAGEGWMSSKYSYAISSVKTHLYRTGGSIKDLLNVIDKLGLIVSACQGSLDLYEDSNVIYLAKQRNYVCLRNLADHPENINIPQEIRKQKCPTWFKDREQAKVTGSTINTAAGLRTLKEQQRHFDRVIDGKTSENETFSPHTQRCMSHGVENELNGVGVLVGKVLPVYMPNAVYYEEGYYTMASESDSNFMIVSPDGSCRINSFPETAVEIKCPLPGKRVVPDVHYVIPNYYICQLLSEMTALNCTCLFYVCWTPQSSTVFMVRYDVNLWNLIKDRLSDILESVDRKPSRPKRKHPGCDAIKEHIKRFRDDHTDFLG